jgi:hypothetical protein
LECYLFACEKEEEEEEKKKKKKKKAMHNIIEQST